ncbi:uncharacterized protein [Solanum tuberosum]|uniref:uncharacterized protein n=1 Tax=Solanum tuberosum TaxID=4113 RepID=UPI00073A2FED|nr:PREDICTED: uncharacterized protein LOC107058846 [Solanum tuberosum]
MNPLKYIFQKAMPTEKLEKWQMLLSEFDIVYMTQKEIKGQALADHLAENPVYEGYELLRTYFPDEEVLFVWEDISESYAGWRMFFDGAVNSRGSGIEAVLISESGQHYLATTKLRFRCTNNMDKYEACILGIRMALDMNVQELLIIGDSNLLIHQVQGEWAVKNPKILPYVQLVHGDLIKVPPHVLSVMSSPWPFAAWGMDVIGPIEPAASNGHSFILVAIDYFTKWVETASYKVVTKKVVADFVRNNLICHFGVPESIVTDNGANLNSHLMKEICEQFKIIHRNSIAYRSQMNGVVEASNKNIKRILRKMIDNYKYWHENLPYAFLGYRTTIRTLTGATLYLLVYETEAVIPAKVEIPSLRIIQEAGFSDDEWFRDRYEQLSLIDEKRMIVACHGQLYQQRMTHAFNKKVRVRTFEVGQ